VTDGRRPIEERLTTAGLPPLPRTAWLEIDLDALTANLAGIRSTVPAGTAVRPVVKADAYGHGAVPIAQALERAGVDGLCVAAFDEAVELRDAGIAAPIVVLYPIPATHVAEAAARDIAVSAGDPVVLAAMLGAAGGMPDAAGGPSDLAIELEVESGLGRDGFDLDGLLDAVRAIEAAAAARLAGLWTHLQAPEDRPRTERQMARFEAAADALRGAGVVLPHRHAAASAGLLVGDVAAYDGIRPGLALYGLVPDEILGTAAGDAAGRLIRPILSLRARPVRVLDLPAGAGIGYGPTFETARPSRIATLPLGYGDGWSRALSNRAEALIRGRRAPIVGNVSMDAVMVDVTDVPGGPVTPADEFTLIGADGEERITAADLARTRTTNSWEVVTAMARRLPRVYDAAPGAVALRTLTVRRP
jgi:alanine racemase